MMRAMSILERKLQELLSKFCNGTHVKGIILHVHRESGEPFRWEGAAGNLDVATPYFYTSVSKLHITAVALKLRVQGKMDLNWKISAFLPEEWTQNLHTYKNRDYTKDICIHHLLSHSSGLPDYFAFERENGVSLLDKLKMGQDQTWTLEDMVNWVKKMHPKFPPGSKGKAHYADTNFQLLVVILEKITGKPLETTIQNLHDNVLGIRDRYLFIDKKDRTPSLFHCGEKPLLIPKAMCAFGPDGGMVGTAKSTMTFLKAFFHAQLFPKEYLTEIQQWKPLGKGHYYGLGISKYHYTGWQGILKTFPYLIGHAGMSGAFAFCMPEKRLYFTGTTNQLNDPYLPIKMVQKASEIIDQIH